MTIRELIKALEVYDSEKEVKLNDFHKGLDDIGVIKEVAEGHVEITRMGYGKEYFEKPLHTDENIKLFSEWCGKSYIRCEGGWWHRYNPQTLENIITTDTLLKWWKERNYTEKETTE